MARTYKRDSRGRFAGGGGGGGGGRKGGGAKKGGRLGGKSSGPKMGASRPGTSAPGGTVAKGAVNRSAGAVMGQGKGTRVKAKATGMKNQVARGREAKAAYKAATSAAREAKMRAGGRTTTRGLSKRTDAGAKNIRANVKAFQAAQRKVKQMETKRKSTRRRKA